MPGSVILSGARTPIGKFGGALSTLSAMDLGGIAIAGALKRARLLPDQVDYVFMGHVLGAGQGQISARQAALNAGIPMTVPSTRVDKVCLSGLNALFLADMLIQAGQAEIVVAGGMESMSGAPYLVPGARTGLRMGDAQIVDSMMFDGLTCAIDHVSMGLATDRHLVGANISRERQDELAALSHERASQAIKSGRFAKEIVPVSVPQRKGDPILVEIDEGVRPGVTVEQLAKLRPAFMEGGTVTAGNASQISDGATAMVVVSRKVAERLGVTPLAEFVGYGQVAGPDTSLLSQPSRAIEAAAANAHVTVDSLGLIEINEAFAAVSAHSMRDLGLSEETVNVNGGAIALGHPLGSSGARIALTLAYEMVERGVEYGSAGLCGGGGQGDAAVLRLVK